MHQRYVALIIFACTFATLSPVRTLANTLPRVVISEMQWGGSALSTADEWIELANTSAESIDISSWKITGIASQNADITLPEGTILSSHATYLVANYAEGDVKSVLATPAQYVTSAVSIPNSELAITLLDNHGNLIDSFSETGTPKTGSTVPHASSVRNLADGTWFTATASKNMSLPETLGSPGYAVFPEIAVPIIEEVSSVVAQADEPNIEVFDATDETLLFASEPALSSDATEGPSLAEIDLSTPEDVIEESSETLENILEEEIVEITSEDLPPEEIVEIALSDQETGSTTDEEPEITDESSSEEVITLITPIVSDVVTAAIVVEETSEEESELASESEIDTSQNTQSVSASTSSSGNDDTETNIVLNLDYSSLYVTEFVSSPLDGKEWVELWNAGIDELSLDGIVLTDASGKATTLTGTIASQAYHLVENPKGKLNNDKDSIIITLPDGQVLFTLAYGTETFPTPKKGVAAGVCSNGWRTDLVPSPAAENICPTTSLKITTYDNELSTSSTINGSSTTQGTPATLQGDVSSEETETVVYTPPLAQVTASVIEEAVVDEVPEKETTSSQKATAKKVTAKTATAKKTTSKTTVLSVDIADLESLESGQHVTVSGTITAEPELFGKRIAYLNGVQLYFHKATWPSLPSGTLVDVTGVWDYDGDRRRIKISDAPDIEIIGSETVSPVSWDNIPADSAGDILVTASGSLTKKEGETYIFSSLTGKDFRVVDVAKTGALTLLKAGDNATVTGMLFPSDGNWILAPRTAEDLVLSAPAALPEAVLPSVSAATTTALTNTSTSHAPLVGGGILVSSVSALGYWFVRSKKLSLLFS